MSLNLISHEFMVEFSLKKDLLGNFNLLILELLKGCEICPKRRFILKDGTELISLVEAYEDDYFKLVSSSGEVQSIHVSDLLDIQEINSSSILEIKKYLKEL